MKELAIGNKTINIYNEDCLDEKMPVVILNTFDEDGQAIWEETQKLGCKNYILVTISNIDWNQEMSPWYMDRLYKTEEEKF